MRKSDKITLLLACFFVVLYIFPCHIRALDDASHKTTIADKASKVDAKLKFSFGHDDNVSDDIENKLESKFAQLYINSKLCTLPTNQTLLSVRLQNGIKYLGAPSLSDESIFINDLDFDLTHRISDMIIPELTGEIRGRTSIHSKSDILATEEAYLKGSAGLGLNTIITSDLTGKIFYNYTVTNFEDFDPFDRNGSEYGVKADLKLLPNATVGFLYSRESMNFDKWDSDGTSRKDVMSETRLYTQFFKFFLFHITYSRHNNKSEVAEYSYHGNRLTLLMAKILPYDIALQLYGIIRSKEHDSSPEEPLLTQIDLEEDERGMLMIKLSKEISKNCSIEAQYDLRRNRSKKEDGIYTKNVISLSLSFDF